MFSFAINCELKIYKILLKSRINKAIEAVKRFEIDDKCALEEKKAVEALKIMETIGFDLYVINKIFMDVITYETEDKVYKVIMENPESIFEKSFFYINNFSKDLVELEKYSKYKSEEIIRILLKNFV